MGKWDVPQREHKGIIKTNGGYIGKCILPGNEQTYFVTNGIQCPICGYMEDITNVAALDEIDNVAVLSVYQLLENAISRPSPDNLSDLQIERGRLYFILNPKTIESSSGLSDPY